MKPTSSTKKLRTIFYITGLILGACFFAAGQQPQTAQPSASPPITTPHILSPGQPIEKALKGGETLEFEFKVKRGRYARIELEPVNIDVLITVLDEDGKTVLEANGDTNYLWRNSISIIAVKNGAYKLRVTGTGPAAFTGGLSAKLAELRKSAPPDLKRIEAERAMGHAIKLSGENNDAEAAQAFEAVIKLWDALGDSHTAAVCRWNLAWIYHFAGRRKEALELHNKALAAFREQGDRIGESAVLNGIGVIYSSVNDADSAQKYLEEARDIRKQLGRLRNEFTTMRALLGIYNSQNADSKLIENLDRMLAVSRELKRRDDERLTLNVLGLFYGTKGRDADAQKHLEMALEIDTELNDLPGQIERSMTLANFYRGKDGDKTFGILQNALKLTRAANDRVNETRALEGLGYYYRMRFDNCGKALELFEQAYAIVQEVKPKNKVDENRILGRINLATVCLADNKRTLEYAELGLITAKELDNKSSQISFLQNVGMALGNMGRIERAKEKFAEALSIAQTEKLQFYEVTSMFALANLYTATGEYEKERELEEKGLAIARLTKERGLIDLLLSALAGTYLQLGENEKALTSYNESLQNAKDANDSKAICATLHKIGLFFAKTREFEKAQKYFEDALKIARDNGLVVQSIYIQTSVGNLLADQGRFDQALTSFESANRESLEFGVLYFQQSTLFLLGNTYSRMNQLEKARGYFERSLARARELQHRNSEALGLFSLGDIYFKLSDYEKALDHFKQAEKIAVETQSKWLMGFAGVGIGAINADLSQNQRAQTSYEQSLSLMREVRDKTGEGNILNAIGSTYLNLKDNKKAAEYFERSRAVAQETRNKNSEVYPLIGLGTVFKNRNEPEKARESFEQGLAIAREVNDRGSQGHALKGLGETAFKMKDYPGAEDYYRRSLAVAREIASKKLEAPVLQNLMELYKEIKRPAAAILYGKLSVNTYQVIRGNIKGFDKESQQSYLKDKEEAYRTLAGLLISQGFFPEAQIVLGLLKDQEYAQLVRTGEKSVLIPYYDAEEDVLAKIEALVVFERQRDELMKLSGQEENAALLLSKIKIANKALDDSLKALAAAEVSVTARIKKFEEDIKGSGNEGEKKASLKNVLRTLKDRTDSGVAALYTVLGEEGQKSENPNANDKRTKFGWVILVMEKGYKAYPIDVTNLDDLVFRFRDSLSTEKYDPQPLAQKIYNAIFRQRSAKQKRTLEQDLQEYFIPDANKTIMWSLDGILRYIPMAALHDGKNYLVEKYRNVIFTNKNFAALEVDNGPDWQVLGLGVSESRGNFIALPGVKTELEAIVKEPNSQTGILGGAIRLNENFTKRSFFFEVDSGRFAVVHIASHYSFNPTSQTESFLLLGDGQVTFGEMEKENDTLFGAVDLLTLSACDTGVGGNGKEAEGFAVNAQQLGAKSVIASLWKVSDKGTPELMIRFYKLMAENPQMSKGEAFRRAQLSLLGAEIKDTKGPTANRAEIVGTGEKKLDLPLFVKDPKQRFAHPHYWASFVLIGNWR